MTAIVRRFSTVSRMRRSVVVIVTAVIVVVIIVAVVAGAVIVAVGGHLPGRVRCRFVGVLEFAPSLRRGVAPRSAPPGVCPRPENRSNHHRRRRGRRNPARTPFRPDRRFRP